MRNFSLFVLLLAQLLNAQTNSTLTEAPVGTHRTDAVSIILCIVFIAIGITYCFWGFKLFRITLFITGFAIFAGLTYTALVQSGTFHEKRDPDLYRYGVSALVGLAGGALVVCCYKLGVTLIGILLGLSVANIILSFIFIEKKWIRIVIQVVFGLIGAIVVNYFERPIIIVGTSLSGAYTAVLGIDIVANVGISNENSVKNGLPREVIGELVGILVLALIGMAYQFKVHKNKRFGQSPPDKGKRVVAPGKV